MIQYSHQVRIEGSFRERRPEEEIPLAGTSKAGDASALWVEPAALGCKKHEEEK